MITRGSKFFYGAALASLLAALLYGFLTGASAHGGVLNVFSDGDLVNSIVGPLTFGWKGWVGEHIGYTVLVGFAVVMAALGGFHSAFRDGDAEAVAQVEHTTEAPPVTVPVGLSYWPIVAAFAATIIVVGLAVSSALFVVGVVLAVVAGFSWTVRAWSERTSADQGANRRFRHELMDPLEIPVAAVLVAGVIVFCVSRLLLALPQMAATFVIIGVAVLIFVTAITLANRPQIKRSVVMAVLVVGGLLVIAAGIAGGVAGESHSSEEGLTGVATHSLPADSSVLGTGGNTDPVGPAGS